MKKFLLYGHGGSYNHGAEAIVRTTIKLIRDKYLDAHITLSSHFPQQDKEFALDVNAIYGPDESFWAIEKKTAEIIERKELARKMYAQAQNQINNDTICLSVGGDVFCYNNWHRLEVFQERAADVGAKSILWCCSIEPSLITQEMLTVLQTYTHIAARESLTYNALKQHGITEKLLQSPDPAFFLEPKSFMLPEWLLKNQIVGINISPLIVRREANPGIIIENIKILIKWITKQTDYNIILIPHVMQNADNDYTLLYELFKELSDDYKKRIYLLDSTLSATEYKYAVSKCRFLVCARTHLSIAAYSLCIPTIVLGYSVKSNGIAKDLGMNDYVLNINKIKDKNSIIDIFLSLFNEYKAVNDCLKSKITDYLESFKIINNLL